MIKYAIFICFLLRADVLKIVWRRQIHWFAEIGSLSKADSLINLSMDDLLRRVLM